LSVSMRKAHGVDVPVFVANVSCHGLRQMFEISAIMRVC